MELGVGADTPDFFISFLATIINQNKELEHYVTSLSEYGQRIELFKAAE